MDMIKVLIAGVQPEVKESIIDALANVEYITTTDGAESSDQVLDMLDQRHIDVVLVDAYISGNGYKLTESIVGMYPDVVVVIIERELKEDTMRAALFSGAKDVLVYPFAPAKLVDSIYRSYQAEKKRKMSLHARASKAKAGSRGQLITVFGTKGGIGKTFLATNLAVSLAQLNGERVALVDLDLDFGNAALALNIIPQFTIADVVNEVANLDQDMMESYLIPHSSGIRLLAANAEPQMTEFVSAEHVKMILSLLQSAFDYVVVDMPARFYDPVEPALQNADILMLATTPEVVTLRNIKSCLNALAALKYPANKIKIILNKVDTRSDIKLKDVEATLNTKIYASLQADYRLVASSMNQGIPVVTMAPRSKISRGFNDLVSKISTTKEAWKVNEGKAEKFDEEIFQEVSN